MIQMIPILKNELRLYFYSWLGWLVLIFINIIASLGYLLGSVNYGNFQHFFSLLEMPFAWSILIVGARSFAKDKELGMYPLFFTSSISLKYIIIAKSLGLFLFFSITSLTLIFYAILSSLFFDIAWMTVITGLFSLLCVILFFSIIAIFASACADNTLIAIIFGFGMWILIYLLGSVGNMLDPNFPITRLLQEISYSYHYKNISSGVYFVSDFVYFVVVYIFMLKLTESKILSQTAF